MAINTNTKAKNLKKKNETEKEQSIKTFTKYSELKKRFITQRETQKADSVHFTCFSSPHNKNQYCTDKF